MKSLPLPTAELFELWLARYALMLRAGETGKSSVHPGQEKEGQVDKNKQKFRVGQVVRVYGVPEHGQKRLLVGYRRIVDVTQLEDRFYYGVGDEIVRESRLKPLTKREAAANRL